MPWITLIPAQEAEGELKDVYRKISERCQREKIHEDRDLGSGGLPVSSRMWRSLIAQRQSQGDVAYRQAYVGDHSRDSRMAVAQLEMISAVKSATLHCRF